MSFRRRKRATARASRDAVLSAGNVVAGVLDFLGELEEGKPVHEAFDAAYTRGKRRKKALKEA